MAFVPFRSGRRGLEHPPHRVRVALPGFRLGGELPPPELRQPVELRPPLVLRNPPLRLDPPPLLHPVKRRIERPLLDPERILRPLRDPAHHRIPVERSPRK